MINSKDAICGDQSTRISHLEKSLAREKIVSRSATLISGVALVVSLFSMTSRYEDKLASSQKAAIKQNTQASYPDINARSIHFFDDNGKEVAHFDNRELYFGSGDQFPEVDNQEPIGTTVDTNGITINSEKQSMVIGSSGLSIIGNNPHRPINDTSRYDSRIDIQVPGSWSGKAIEISEKNEKYSQEKGGDYYIEEIGKDGFYIADGNAEARLTGASLSLRGYQKGSVTLGEANLDYKETGAKETTSVGSLTLFDKNGAVRWRTQ